MPTLNKPEPKPRRGKGRAIWDLVIADMRERDLMGKAKYGRRLRARDGRDHLVDAYQEALDLAVYLRQEIEERRLASQPTPRLRVAARLEAAIAAVPRRRKRNRRRECSCEMCQ